MNDELLDNIEDHTLRIQMLVHKLNGHPIYGHVFGSRNAEISNIMHSICDHLILIQQDIKFLKYKEEVF